MIVLIAVKGGESEMFFRRVSDVAPLREAARVILAHVIDAAALNDPDHGREFYLGFRSARGVHQESMLQAEIDNATASLQFARQALIQAGVLDERLEEITALGRTAHELLRLAEQRRADLIVVGGRPGKPGPHSIGKTARFLIDHAPNAALLVR
ncbi:MAG: universal stress protein [Chloroflexota bacterium]